MKLHTKTRAALAALSLAVALPAMADTVKTQSAPPPQIGNAQPTPAAAPYPDASLAPKQVQEAFKTAAKTHRKVLLDFGGNWCPDCRILAGIFDVPAVNTWVQSQFVVVPVNVNRFNANMDIAAHYGVTIKAVPTVLIITPEGKLLDQDGTAALGNARTMSPQAVLDLIGQWNQRG